MRGRSGEADLNPSSNWESIAEISGSLYPRGNLENCKITTSILAENYTTGPLVHVFFKLTFDKNSKHQDKSDL